MATSSSPFLATVETQAIVEQSVEEILHADIDTIAKRFSIPSTTLYNVATSESGFQADPPGHNDGGLACGVVQIHAKEWGFDCQELKDHPEIGLTFLAKHIKAGDAWKYWTSLNCYSYLKYALKLDLPKMAQIVPQAFVPKVGAVAVFSYTDKEVGGKVKHVAYVTKVMEGSFEVLESNFEAGKIGRRVIHMDDPHLGGFWYA